MSELENALNRFNGDTCRASLNRVAVKLKVSKPVRTPNCIEVELHRRLENSIPITEIEKFISRELNNPLNDFSNANVLVKLQDLIKPRNDNG